MHLFELQVKSFNLPIEVSLLVSDHLFDLLALLSVALIALVTVIIESLGPGKHLVDVLAAQTVAIHARLSARLLKDLNVV